MRKRSKYKPKGVIMNTVHHVLSGFQMIKDCGDKAVKLRIKNHDALASMVAGRGTRKDIDILIASMNITEALIRTSDLGSDYRAEIKAAQDAIFSMAQRGLERGKFLFTGTELTAINLGMEIHDAQLDVCTVAQLERALGFVEQEIKGRRARVIA